MAVPPLEMPVPGRRRWTLAAGLALIGAWLLAALLAPWLAPYPPEGIDFTAVLQAPGPQHWFGTDPLGRDVFSRVLAGARQALLVAPAAMLLGVTLGAGLGLGAAYAGGWADELVMRALDAVMAFPLVVLAMLALAFLGGGTVNVVLVVGFVFAPLVARSVRAAALAEVRREYVLAARLRGESPPYILLIEVLPNIRRVLLVEATIRLGYAIFTAATLGFLGLGVQPPTPDWGAMVNENQGLLTTAPWTVLFPALAIAWVVVGIGLVADGIEEKTRP